MHDGSETDEDDLLKALRQVQMIQQEMVTDYASLWARFRAQREQSRGLPSKKEMLLPCTIRALQRSLIQVDESIRKVERRKVR